VELQACLPGELVSVEKIVDYFRDLINKIPFSPLVNTSSGLVGGASLYLSSEIQRTLAKNKSAKVED
jgi:hypothetical protein